jgi:hypothetical protein
VRLFTVRQILLQQLMIVDAPNPIETFFVQIFETNHERAFLQIINKTFLNEIQLTGNAIFGFGFAPPVVVLLLS